MQRRTFFGRLSLLFEQRGPLCIGLDPSREVLEKWNLPDSPKGALSLVETVLDAAADLVGVFKPQSAFFERFGPEGFESLRQAVALVQEAGCLCLIDAKRGDISSTMIGYASAFLGPNSALGADAITANPFLGLDALEPLRKACFEEQCGAFVVVRSSNPEGEEIQDARVPDGRTVSELLLDRIQGWNEEAEEAVGPIGVVLGATAEVSVSLARRVSNALILAPGLGSQGAEARHLRPLLEAAPGRVIPSTSRSVLFEGPARDSIRQKVQETKRSIELS